TTLRMHGIGELRPQLEQRARQPDLARQVCIAGPLDAVQLASALRAARVLVIPSRIESIPLILGDGAQAGVVVIGTDVGDVGRVIRAEGLGSVVPPEDPNALADALLAELDDRRARRTAAHSHFSFEATARRLLAALEAAPGEVA
ncbi:MAG TPA: glycosyltransferase, partial [Gammaproteobacteria bacterium]|nr:glycosyltransferase [Gammaproteobacteria bacterium]